jgi:hypothetical protein
VYHLQAIARARIVGLPLSGAHCSAQRQAADATHSINSYSHAVYPVAVSAETLDDSSIMEI